MPGARDDEPVPLIFDVGMERVPAGAICLATSGTRSRSTAPFELFRLRLGRRSRRQVEAMAWSADPASVLPHLFVFGPSPHDIID